MNFEPIADNLKTKEDLEDYLGAVDHLVSNLYKNKGKYSEKKLFEAVGVNKHQAIKKSFSESGLKITSKKDLESYLSALKEELTNYKILELTLAFDPTSKTIESITNWIKEYISPSIVANITVDRTIVAGVIIEYQGKHKDYSVAKKLEDNQTKVQEIIRKQLDKKLPNDL